MVAALVTRTCPVRDLVPAIADVLEGDDRVVVLAGRPILVLARPDGVAPRWGALRRHEVVALGAGQTFGHWVVERQRIERKVVGGDLERRVQRVHPGR